MRRAVCCCILALPATVAFLGPVTKVQRVRPLMSVVDEKKTTTVSSVTSPTKGPPTGAGFSTTSVSTPSKPSTSTSTSGALVPINPKNIETSAGLVAAGASTLVFGPVFGILLGLITNYVAKVDNDAGEAARGVGKGTIELLNFFSKVNDKYGVGAKVSETSSDLYNRLKESGNPSSFKQIEETINNSKKKLSEINEQYDLTDKTRTAADALVDLSGAAIDKALELNEKYALVDKTKEVAQSATAKLKEQIEKSQ